MESGEEVKHTTSTLEKLYEEGEDDCWGNVEDGDDVKETVDSSTPGKVVGHIGHIPGC